MVRLPPPVWITPLSQSERATLPPTNFVRGRGTGVGRGVRVHGGGRNHTPTETIQRNAMTQRCQSRLSTAGQHGSGQCCNHCSNHIIYNLHKAKWTRTRPFHPAQPGCAGPLASPDLVLTQSVSQSVPRCHQNTSGAGPALRGSGGWRETPDFDRAVGLETMLRGLLAALVLLQASLLRPSPSSAPHLLLPLLSFSSGRPRWSWDTSMGWWKMANPE